MPFAKHFPGNYFSISFCCSKALKYCMIWRQFHIPRQLWCTVCLPYMHVSVYPFSMFGNAFNKPIGPCQELCGKFGNNLLVFILVLFIPFYASTLFRFIRYLFPCCVNQWITSHWFTYAYECAIRVYAYTHILYEYIACSLTHSSKYTRVFLY